MVKIGDKVVCKYVGDTTNLTLGKTYTVIDTHPFASNKEEIVWVEDDNKRVEAYAMFFFSLSTTTNNLSELPPGTTAKVLSNKPHLAYFDPHLEYEMGLGMRKGAEKHGWNNHRNLTDEAAQQIVDSIKRHLNAYLREEQIDPELQINHLACVVNNINFLYRLDRKFGYEAVLDSIYGITK